MTYHLTEKALKTSVVGGYNGFQSFDVGVATEINIECAVLLHEIRKVDYQLNFNKKTHLLEEKDIEGIIEFLNPLFSKTILEKSIKKLIKNMYIKNLK